MDEFFKEYQNLINEGFGGVDIKEVERACQILWAAASAHSYIFVGGNGGSAAISNHLVCDFLKGLKSPWAHDFKVVSLSSNTPLLTAISNDWDYSETLKAQLEVYLKSSDYYDFSDCVVILISSSGNSPNIIKAAEYARDKGCAVIGLSGFGGGKLKELADCKIHVPVDNYGVVEDVHQSIMHIMSQYIRKKREDYVTG